MEALGIKNMTSLMIKYMKYMCVWIYKYIYTHIEASKHAITILILFNFKMKLSIVCVHAQ